MMFYFMGWFGWIHFSTGKGRAGEGGAVIFLSIYLGSFLEASMFGVLCCVVKGD